MKLPKRLVIFALYRNNTFRKNISKRQTVIKRNGLFTTAMPLLGSQIVVNKDTSSPGQVCYLAEIHINSSAPF